MSTRRMLTKFCIEEINILTTTNTLKIGGKSMLAEKKANSINAIIARTRIKTIVVCGHGMHFKLLE